MGSCIIKFIQYRRQHITGKLNNYLVLMLISDIVKYIKKDINIIIITSNLGKFR